MKKISYLLFFPCLFLTSCIALHDGVLQQPLVKLEKNNFSYVRTVSGSATATYILGIGGNRDGLIQGSLNKFRANLKPNQALINISIDERKTWFALPLLYQQKKVTVSADIIEFTNVGDENKIKRKDITVNDNNEIWNGFKVGDNCFVELDGNFLKAVVLNNLHENKMKVRLIHNDEIVIVNVRDVLFEN